ncbi:Zinc finger A20 and AN1 domain-containing stress-associated protein 8 [Ancistrocladus abbreviatus]
MFTEIEEMEHKETGCQAPEGPILCINNCGFFGSATTMNMCSKCHKEMILKQEQAKLAASSIENIVNGGCSDNNKDPVLADTLDVQVGLVDTKAVCSQGSSNSTSMQSLEAKKEGPSRCSTCHKRVGLLGFSCKCGYLFCAAHRYSDKHNCLFDYRAAAQDALAKANPVIKAEKLDKI